MTVASLPFHVQGSELRRSPWRVLAGGDRTNGPVAIGDAHITPRASGPGRHVHTREDEAIYIVSGVLTPSGLDGLFLEQADYFAGLTGEPDETILLEMSERYGVYRADGGPIA